MEETLPFAFIPHPVERVLFISDPVEQTLFISDPVETTQDRRLAGRYVPLSFSDPSHTLRNRTMRRKFEPSMAYAIGFEMSSNWHGLVELLARVGVPCGIPGHSEEEATIDDIVRVLSGPMYRNLYLLEAALSAMARRDVFLLLHDDPHAQGHRPRKAFLAQCHLPIPEACSLSDIPFRSFRPDDMAYVRKTLGISGVTQEVTMLRCEERSLDYVDGGCKTTEGQDVEDDEAGARCLRKATLRSVALSTELVDEIMQYLYLGTFDIAAPLWWIPFDRRVAATLTDLLSASTLR